MTDSNKSKQQLLEEIEKLRQYADGLNNFLQGTNIGTWEWNIQSGEVICNERWAQIVGYTLDELKPTDTKIWEVLVHPEDKKKSDKLMDLHFSGELDYFDIECRLKHKNGHWVWVHDRGQVISWTDDGIPLMMCGTHTDITDRKQAEYKLCESEERYRVISELTSDYAYVFRVESNGDLINEWVTGAFFNLTGYSRKDLESLGGWENLILPDDLSIPLDQLKSLLSNQSSTIEYRIVTKSGDIRWMKDYARPIWSESENRVISIEGAVQDITKQKQAEENLLKSFELIKQERNLFVSGPVVVFKWKNRKDWPFEYISPNISEVFGFTADDFMSEKVSYASLIHEEDIERVTDEMLAHDQRVVDRYVYEPYRIKRKDGKIIWLANYTTFTRDDTGNITHFLGYVFEVTKLKQTEELLRQSEERLELAMQGAGIGLWDHDLINNVVIRNDQWAKMLGYSLDEIKNDRMFWKDLVHPDDLPNVEKTAKDHEEGRTPLFRVEHRLKAKNGDWRWILNYGKIIERKDDGKPVRAVGIHFDITERMQAEKSIRVNESKLQSIFRVAPTGIGVVINRVIKQVNKQMCEMTGYSNEELINQNARLLYLNDEEFEHVGREKYDQIRDYGTGTVETRWVRKDGQIIHVLLSSTPLDLDDPTKGVTFTALDITERKLVEEALQDSEEKYRLLVDNTDTGFVVVDEKGIVIEANEPYLRLVGVEHQDEIIDHSVISWTAPECEEENKAAVALCAKQGYIKNFETTYLLKDGSRVEILVNAVMHETSKGKRLSAQCFNITERKRVEKVLRNSEEYVRTVLESTADGILAVDIDGNVKQANHRFAEMWRIPKELLESGNDDQLLNHVLDQLKDPKAFISKVEQLYGKTDEDLDLLEFKDGRIFERFSCPLKRNGKLDGRVWSFRDITERKQADEALRESEDKLLEAQKIAHLGYYSLDIKSGFWTNSPELDKIFGIDSNYKRDVNGWLNIVHPCYREIMKKYLQDEVMSQHRKFDKEYKIVDVTTGQEKWVHGLGNLKIDEHGNPIEMFGTFQDITERNQAEEKLRDSEEKFRKFVENAPGFVCIYDCYPDGKRDTIYLGPGLDKLFDKTTIKKKNHSISKFLELIHPQDYNAFNIAADNSEETNSLFDFEYRIQLSDNKTKWIHSVAQSVKRNDGIVRWYSQIFDITETKRLQALEARAERLEMAGTIAGQVAHDFNNLLGPIMGYPEFIREELAHDNKAHAYLDTIELAAKKIAYINQDLLTMGRRGHYNQQVINLNRVVLQVIQEMDSRIKTVSCEKNLSENLFNIKGGNAQIHRALSNLLVNALDAMQDIGQITIKTENYYADDTSVAFNRVPKGEYVKLTVSDNGCGIPDDIIEKILDPFFSTKTTDKKRGSGLGLSVVDAVMKDHDGYLDMSSKIGIGTSFYLYFPVTREEVESNESAPVIGGEEKILVIDDDEIQREVSKQLLGKLGYEVSSVESGEKAIEFLQDNPQDLVILDMVMPNGIDGVETYRQILEIYPHQKAIILSGYSESNLVLEVQKLGAGAFVRKPITKNVIAAAVRTEFDRHREKVVTANF